MNYYDYLNKKLANANGTNGYTVARQAASNPFAPSVFNNSQAVNYAGNNIFIKADKNDLEKIDYTKLASSNNENLNALEYVLKEFLAIEAVKKQADKSGEGELSVEEIKEFVAKLVSKDGNANDLSLEDFEQIIKENNINLEELLSFAESQGAQSSDSTNAAADAAPAQAANYSAPVSNSTSADISALKNQKKAAKQELKTAKEELKTAKSEHSKAEKEIKNKEKALANAKAGDNARIKEAKNAEEKAKDNYENAVEKDEGIKHLKEEIKENNKAIEKNTENLEKTNLKIEEKNKSLTDLDSTVTTLKSDLSALQGELSSIPAETGKQEDKEADAVYRRHRQDLNKRIAAKKKEITKKNEQLEALKGEIKELEAQKEALEKEKVQLNEKRTQLETEVTEKGNEVTKKALEAYQKARENTEKVKQEEIEKAEKELDEAKKVEEEAAKKVRNLEAKVVRLEQKIEDLDSQISAAESNPTSSYAVNGGGYSYGGDSASGTSQDATVHTQAASGTNTGKDFSYTGSSQAIKQDAIRAGYFSDKNSGYTPKRGDIAVWTKTASTGHVGIVEKVYPDGSFDVIEGNSSNRVKRNHYKSIKSMGRTFAGFCRSSEWLGSSRAENAARVAENELSKGVREIGSSNDSEGIRKYKRGAKNNYQWCAYFTSYCFHDGQRTLA